MARRRGWGGNPPQSDEEASSRIVAAAVGLVATTGSAVSLADVRGFVVRQKLFGVIMPPSVSEDERVVDILRVADRLDAGAADLVQQRSRDPCLAHRRALGLERPEELAALDGGMSKAAVCRNFAVKRTTLVETLARQKAIHPKIP